jgi:hypothetical protein
MPSRKAEGCLTKGSTEELEPLNSDLSELGIRGPVIELSSGALDVPLAGAGDG